MALWLHSAGFCHSLSMKGQGSSCSIHSKHLANINRATNASTVICSMNRDAFQVQHPCKESACHLSNPFAFSLSRIITYTITFIYCINVDHVLLASEITLLANPFHCYATLHLYILFVWFMFEALVLSV